MELSSSQLSIQRATLADPQTKINNFLSFCKKDITPAIQELPQKNKKQTRLHLQKLVYTNLIDRFDFLISNLLIWSGINNPRLREELFKQMPDDAMPKKDVLRLFYMGGDVYDYIKDEIEKTTNSTFLRETHWKKVRKIMESVAWPNLEKPRVYNNNGKILEKTKKHKTYPNTVSGYADWLYIRRNCIVHGEGTKYSQEIKNRFKGQYAVDLPSGIALSTASIESAMNFYQDFCAEYLERLEKTLSTSEE